MSVHVLLNLLSLEKEIKCEACQAFYFFFATSLINSIKMDLSHARFYQKPEDRFCHVAARFALTRKIWYDNPES